MEQWFISSPRDADNGDAPTLAGGLPPLYRAGHLAMYAEIDYIAEESKRYSACCCISSPERFLQLTATSRSREFMY